MTHLGTHNPANNQTSSRASATGMEKHKPSCVPVVCADAHVSPREVMHTQPLHETLLFGEYPEPH